MPVAALDAAAAATTSDGGCELADVLRRYGADFADAHALRSPQHKAIRAITACRTAALGGHRQWCESCGYQRYVYHSCRNRHCPQCQSTTKAAWVKARQDELLPVPYFHNVFTLPHELSALVLYSERNQRALLKLLFDAAAQTLLEFGRQEFSGKVGFSLLLHTWDQQLRPHFHVHCLIASGALSADGSRWIAGGREFLFPVRGLSKMFRAKYLDGLAGLLEKNQLDLPPQLVQLGDPTRRTRWLRPLRKRAWVVYSQRPFAGPRKLLDYLDFHCRSIRFVDRLEIRAPVWPSPITASSAVRTAGSVSTTATAATATGARSCRYLPMSLSAASSSTCCPTASCESATTACWPIAARRKD